MEMGRPDKHRQARDVGSYSRQLLIGFVLVVNPARHRPPKMSMFRAKKLDLGCFVKARTIRDHTKRKVFEEFETERCALSCNPYTPEHPIPHRRHDHNRERLCANLC